jgi:predicted O-methyltransferase YrrM
LSIISKIKSGFKDPKKGLEYLILGEKKYNSFYSHDTTHSCVLVKDTDSLLEFSMTQPSDIHEHLLVLHLLTVELNLKNVLELGTRTGESTVALISAIKKIDGKMTSVDIDPCEEAKKKVKSLGLENYWNFIQTDDLELDWNEKIDHLFVDSDHSYEHVLSELKKFEPFVRKGGLITLHDTVTDPRVLKAINDFISQRDDITFYHFFNNNGLVILRKI